MISDFTYTKQVVDLKRIEDLLSSFSLTTQIFERTPEFPMNLLVAESKDKSGNIVKSISICYLPIDDGELAEIQFLQLYTGYPFVVHDEILSDMLDLINLVNNKTVLGYFGLTEQNQLFQRAMYAQKTSSIDFVIELREVLATYFKMQELFGSRFLKIKELKLTISQFKSQLLADT